ncbi:helix-turn-helix domain-containing protein [Sediminitomix flava]|uniref:AraC-like DNA-binding protein n=1 Tax=Sediminitomix flava TaxID=379075 RepID=A0A315Z5Q8_SEDFL|nr:helix-turn-helix transcriptional regulator [Sediminitomix flava]PWJ38539.1 AraC-like DNA-binding protein [Sediminitomix flava]
MENTEPYKLYANVEEPHKAFKKLAEEQNGSWNGEELQVHNDLFDLNLISYHYMDGLYVEFSNMATREPTYLIHEPHGDKHFIIIRIGFTGSYGKNQNTRKFNHDGIFIYNSNQQLDIEYPVQSNNHWMIIRFPITDYQKIDRDPSFKLKKLFEDKSPWFQYYSLDPEIESYVKEVHTISENISRRRMVFFSRAIDILAALKDKMETDEIHVPKANIHPEDLKSMLLIKDQMLFDFTVLPNLDDISKEHGMSISKLNRLFKSVYKLPVLQFFNQHKLEEAHRHIKYSDKSLTEIAFDLGFSNLGHMSRSFKSYFGYSPSYLRSSLQQQSA